MQIIRPDMLPFAMVLVMLILVSIGIIGLISIRSGVKGGIRNLGNIPSIGKTLIGIACLGFVLSNWIGYQSIYAENEMLIVGRYTCGAAVLTIHADHTWKMNWGDKSNTSTGEWQYVMSEDWCYWELKSNDFIFKAQTGSSKRVNFKKQRLNFTRKNEIE